MNSDVEALPQAPRHMWHHVNSVAMTRALVTDEAIRTRCGKRLRVTTPGGGFGGSQGMPQCPECETIRDIDAVLYGAWPLSVDRQVLLDALLDALSSLVEGLSTADAVVVAS